MTVLAALTVSAVLESTLPSLPLSYIQNTGQTDNCGGFDGFGGFRGSGGFGRDGYPP